MGALGVCRENGIYDVLLEQGSTVNSTVGTDINGSFKFGTTPSYVQILAQQTRSGAMIVGGVIGTRRQCWDKAAVLG